MIPKLHCCVSKDCFGSKSYSPREVSLTNIMNFLQERSPSCGFSLASGSPPRLSSGEACTPQWFLLLQSPNSLSWLLSSIWHDWLNKSITTFFVVSFSLYESEKNIWNTLKIILTISPVTGRSVCHSLPLTRTPGYVTGLSTQTLNFLLINIISL